MAINTTGAACPDDRLMEIVSDDTSDEAHRLDRASNLLAEYPDDARLLFLQGSLLAALRRYGEARDAMSAAVRIAPGYEIARFQLGFLEFTSGDAASAAATWAPLKSLAADHPLHLFVLGLTSLAQDRFDQAIEFLEAGIAANLDLAPLNADMRRLIEGVREAGLAPRAGKEPVSAAHLLLRQYGADQPRH